MKSSRNGAPKLLVNDRFYKQFSTLAVTPSKLFINDRFYKQFRPLGFACSKPFINNRFYKQSRPCGMTNSELSRNDRFYKWFMHLDSIVFLCRNNLSGPKTIFHLKTISQIFSFQILPTWKEIVWAQELFRESKHSFA